jgi:hypothetical protein
MNQRRALVAGIAIVVCAVVSGHLKLIAANPKFVVILKDLTKSTRADQDSLNNCASSPYWGLDGG